jgi:hypothetical protein
LLDIESLNTERSAGTKKKEESKKSLFNDIWKKFAE